jgi:hypothetical protein
MRTVVYHTSVDSDVEYDPAQFAREVDIYLADPDGWSQIYKFARGPRGIAIRLCRPETLKSEGCMDDELSCATLNGKNIWLNARRWMHGAPKSHLPLEEYRQYMVSHEMGHALGYDHAKCPGSGPVPVMVQQTLGIGSCTPNTKLTAIDLRSKQ